MPQTCKICRHEKRQEIDQALLEGTPFRDIAGRFGTSKSALLRHKQTDIPGTLVKAKQAEEIQDADSLFERLRSLSNEARGILEEARASKDHAIALNAIGRAEKLLELEAKLLGELNNSTKVAVGINVNLPAPESKEDLAIRMMGPEQLAVKATNTANSIRKMAGLPPLVGLIENKVID